MRTETLRRQVERALGGRVTSLAVCDQEWSNSGARHLSGVWRATGEAVLVKVGADGNEVYWTRQMAEVCPELIPRLFAAGERLGDSPEGWLVMEQIQFGPLGPLWRGAEFAMALEAGVRFQRAARQAPVGPTPRVEVSTVRGWLECGLRRHPPGPAKALVARAEEDFAWVLSVCGREVCHHDLHLANVMARTASPARSQGLLIDVGAVVQPWPFDAAYLEVLNSGASRPGAKELVPQMAQLRREHGLPASEGEELERLATVVLAWFALCLWGRNPERHENHLYAEATREYLERSAEAAR